MINGIDRLILQVLTESARVSLKELAGRVGLSSPSTSERIRRLEDRGIIRGYRAELDPQALGLAIQAIVRIKPLPGRTSDVQKHLERCREVIECDKVTGEDCFVARIVVPSINRLDEVVDNIAVNASTNTAIVKSQPIRRRAPEVDAEG